MVVYVRLRTEWSLVQGCKGVEMVARTEEGGQDGHH
jgi:hypothetical protein